jgi:hypothetical protein
MSLGVGWQRFGPDGLQRCATGARRERALPGSADFDSTRPEDGLGKAVTA